MIHALLMPLALLAPADTAIEPITSDLMTLAIESGLMDESCDLYGQVIPLLGVALDGDFGLAMDITDAYFVANFEEGYGPGARLTDEAHEVVESYLHSCI